jgi:hypothetical protein
MSEITHAASCEVRQLDGVRCTCGARSNPAPIATLFHCVPGKPAVVERFPLTRIT